VAAKHTRQRVLRKVSGNSRRADYSSATRRALVEVAMRLFTAQGYAGTSLDQIVAGARVTKGALYHHFDGKQALFESVFEKVEDRCTKTVTKALRNTGDPWDKAMVGLRAFLEVVQEPAYRRIVVQEGPSVLGYERFREQEERSAYGIVQDIVSSVLDSYTEATVVEPGTVEAFTRLFYGAMAAAGTAVAAAEDPERASREVAAAMDFILTGMRALGEAGIAPAATSAP
jgi:AcrR family transcriptional regulator